MDFPTAPPCSPKRHVMFLKTHKTGSTTVQNMMLRYIDKANLTLAVPQEHRVTFVETKMFSPKYIRNYKAGKTYDVITHHLRFNPKELKKVLKHNDTFYFSILRNPVTQMESSFSFFKKDFPAFSSAKSLEDFLNNASEYHNARHPKNSRVKNPTWFDFGYNNRDNCSEEQYTKALREIERSMDFPTAPPCSPKRHVMFLKTHKTGGSTVQNMMLRYIDKANLTLAVPQEHRVTFVETNYFSPKYIRNYKAGKTYDVITHHLRFNPKELKKVLKHNDTFYFSILRNPVTQMESSFSFFKKDFPAFSSAKSLEDFLNNARKYHNTRHPKNSRVKNPTWFDFGYNNRQNFSEQQFTKALREIERSFNLILIAEYFDESMILLKEFLCWDIDDVVTFKHNSRNE
ncbi:hypothetical protein JZ751_028293, partial [Albula glossodonta]